MAGRIASSTARLRWRTIIPSVVAVSAMLLHAPLAVSQSTARSVAGRAPLHLVADLTARMLYVLTGDDTTASYPIAIGDSAHPTPTGAFHIRRIVWNPKWVPPEEHWAIGKSSQRPGARANPMRLVKIFFKEPSYYIHGSNEPRSIGYALSHGCLRMEPMDAYHVARLLMERGGVHRSALWYRHLLRVRTANRTVRLPHPIAMTIVP